MADINEVVQNLRNIKTYLQGQAIEASANMDDVSREALIESQKVIDDALELLKEQQPKTGHWEKRTGMMPPEYHGHYWCSNCEWHGKYNERETDYKFCPACGAKMEKPTDA